ncbi:hypothetical protein Tco_0707985 [Tanacetum coccineum]
MTYQGGTEGVVGLTQWFERMETVFHISNYAVENQVKFATCTLLGVALTLWNSHVKTVGHDAAYSNVLENSHEDDDCQVKGTYVVGYTKHFQELTLMCGRMFPGEYDEVEKYFSGLPDMIQGNVIVSLNLFDIEQRNYVTSTMMRSVFN